MGSQQNGDGERRSTREQEIPAGERDTEQAPGRDIATDHRRVENGRQPACVDVCPADAIVALKGVDEAVKGTPHIDPERQPCVVCDGLECMAVCPSGALLRLPLEQVRIGSAEVDPEVCVRSTGEDCRECITLCPLGERAIGLDKEGAVRVMLDGCVGCGVCQHVCPTSPKAIVVVPVW